MSYQRSKFYSYFVTFWEEGQNDKMEFLIAEMCEHIFFCAELEDWGSFPSRDFLLVSYLSGSALNRPNGRKVLYPGDKTDGA